jgi:hypothetical protein
MPPSCWRKKSKESKKKSSHRGAAFDDVEVRGTSRAELSSNEKHQKRKSLPNSKPKSKQPTVEDADTAGDREYETRLNLKAPNGETKLRVAIRLLEAAANTLAEIGDAEEIEALFQANGADGEKTVQEMRRNCFSILQLLPEARSINNFSADEVPSTIDLYGQSFLFRASSSLIYLLKPIDVFKGNSFYNRHKVFGFVRTKKSTAALMTALSGWVQNADPHPKLLDSGLWTKVVKPFADFHNHKFKTAGYDTQHKKEKGYTHASHVEPRLMVWYAIDLLQKHTGKVGSPLDQRGDLWKLSKKVQDNIEAEIVLSRPPCDQCLAFQKFFEEYTPIKFSFIVMTNLGKAMEVRNSLNKPTFSLFAPPYSDSESESGQAVEEDDEYAYISRQATPPAERRQKKRFQIVIPSRPATQRKETQYAANTDAEAGSEEEIEVQTRVRVSKANRQIDFEQYYHTPPKSRETSKKRMRTYGNSSDEDEYEPPSKSRSRNVATEVMTPKRKNLTRNGTLTPPQSAEFGRDAQEYARRINKKRMR